MGAAKKVLLVDDEVGVTEVLSDLIKDDSREVFVANSVVDAEKILGQQKIDVVVSDIKMPGQDGFDLLKVCQKLTPAPSLYFFSAVMTVPADQADIVGAKGSFQKPAELEALLAQLDRLTKIKS